MEQTPKSLRIQIGIFGRTNVGKSSFLNMICGQDIAVTSAIAGTTTDVVEKAIELLPIGPVVFLDTAGMDDTSVLAAERLKKTNAIFSRADVVVCITEPEQWTTYEDAIAAEAAQQKAPLIIVINKTDISAPSDDFITQCKKHTEYVMNCSSIAAHNELTIAAFKELLLAAIPEDRLVSAPIIGDLLPPGGIVVMVVPIDLQAPRGRLILPQVQTIRDTLDADATAIVVKEREYAHMLSRLNVAPDLVICDSQVVMKTVADTPPSVLCTTFSIVFSRYKGDLIEQAAGLAVIDFLKDGDKVLIAEACSHHALADDIGRVKIPRWLRQYTGVNLTIDVYNGRDYPPNLKDYSLIVHCGSCMLTRKETMARIALAKDAGVPITNYGLCISMIQGVLKRALSPFPAALDAYTCAQLNYTKI
jgi:[FeFe] hydrogenase H-cluster maturation GTPase HydF